MTDYYAVINAKKRSSNVKDCISDSINIKISYNIGFYLKIFCIFVVEVFAFILSRKYSDIFVIEGFIKFSSKRQVIDYCHRNN